MADWIETFMAVTEGMPSPPRFRLWTAIGVLAGALERRVWTPTFARRTYPNLFISLAGQSGSGKSVALTLARELWVNVRELKLAPDDVTTASFYDALAACIRSYVNGTGMTIYTAMSVLSRELGNFMPKYDIGFLSNLSDLYDNPPNFDSKRRHSTSVTIDKPTVNILCAVTPGFLSDLLPEVAWKQGFTSRMIFIHDHLSLVEDTDIFEVPEELNSTNLLSELQEFFKINGEFIWAENARREFNAWRRAGLPPIPNHSRLVEYCTRRTIHTLKLAMVSAVSAGRELYVTLEDFERAQEWLFDAEAVMPDVFRAMGQKSDTQVIHDLWFHLYTIQSGTTRTGQTTPVPAEHIWSFLGERVESYRVKPIIELAVNSGVLVKDKYGDAYHPRPESEHTLKTGGSYGDKAAE